jgi:hypothetical protein
VVVLVVVVVQEVALEEVVVQEADWEVAEAWEPVPGAALGRATTMALVEGVDWEKESATLEASTEDHIGVLAATVA